MTNIFLKFTYIITFFIVTLPIDKCLSDISSANFEVIFRNDKVNYIDNIENIEAKVNYVYKRRGMKDKKKAQAYISAYPTNLKPNDSAKGNFMLLKDCGINHMCEPLEFLKLNKLSLTVRTKPEKGKHCEETVAFPLGAGVKLKDLPKRFLFTAGSFNLDNCLRNE